MAKNEDIIRTYPSKALIIFLASVIVLSAGVVVGAFFLIDNLALKIVLSIFCAIFFVLSFIVLFNEALNYISLDKQKRVVCIHKFLRKISVPLNELSRIENIEGFYVFRTGEKELYRLGTNVTGVNELIVQLERCGINIKW